MEILLAVLGTALYFLPTLIGTKKRNINAIFVLNLLLGWTLVGWVVALVWATTAEPPAPVAPAPVGAERIARLKSLRDQGLLTQEEFMQQVGSL